MRQDNGVPDVKVHLTARTNYTQPQRRDTTSSPSYELNRSTVVVVLRNSIGFSSKAPLASGAFGISSFTHPQCYKSRLLGHHTTMTATTPTSANTREFPLYAHPRIRVWDGFKDENGLWYKCLEDVASGTVGMIKAIVRRC